MQKLVEISKNLILTSFLNILYVIILLISIKKKKRWKRLSKFKKITVFGSISLVLILGIGLFIVLIPRLFGLTPHLIEDSAMYPTYMNGSLVYIHPIDTQEILVGDVVSYYENQGEQVKTRRIIAVDNANKRVYTKADTEQQGEEGYVNWRNIIGRPVFQIPYVGLFLSQRVLSWARGIFFGIALCLTAFTTWNTFDKLRKKEESSDYFLE
ncbi:signal peptidase I [Enterococcus faecalis 13-SD-W-01]|nr:signal peptidase I [Enterococcus faecalis 13-SD-W-01]